MKKVAKLVTVVLTTRVVVDENASDENIFEAAREGLKTKAKEEMFENLDKIEDDTECPYGTFEGEKKGEFTGGSVLYPAYYQPDLEHPDLKHAILVREFSENDVFESKSLAEKVFPNVEIKTYFGDDIANPNYVDEDFK